MALRARSRTEIDDLDSVIGIVAAVADADSRAVLRGEEAVGTGQELDRVKALRLAGGPARHESSRLGPERGRARLVDAATLCRDRHGVVPLGAASAHHAHAHAPHYPGPSPL